jgi:hypothetical protein
MRTFFDGHLHSLLIVHTATLFSLLAIALAMV